MSKFSRKGKKFSTLSQLVKINTSMALVRPLGILT